MDYRVGKGCLRFIAIFSSGSFVSLFFECFAVAALSLFVFVFVFVLHVV